MSRLRRWLALVAAGAATAVAVAGCVPTSAYVTARKIESAASQSVMDSYEAWRQVDLARQRQILGAASTLLEYHAKVGAWRNDVQAPIDKAFVAARDALSAYASALDASDAVRTKDFGAAIAKVVSAVQQLAALLAQYGVKVPIPGGT